MLSYYLAIGRDLPSATLRLDDLNGPILSIFNRDRHYWKSLFYRACSRHCTFFIAERPFGLVVHAQVYYQFKCGRQLNGKSAAFAPFRILSTWPLSEMFPFDSSHGTDSALTQVKLGANNKQFSCR
jgi:hypothetical protein